MSTLKAYVGGQWVYVGSGTNTNTNEVWVGNTPTDPNVELWYDNSAVNFADPNSARWNSAWGVISRATMPDSQSVPITTWTAASGPLTVTLFSGRRYRLVFHCRAWQSSNGNPGTLRISAWDGATTGAPTFGFDDYANGTGQQYAGFTTSVCFTGDQVGVGLHTITLALMSYSSTVAASVFAGEFYIEDVGPISNAIVAATPPPTAWQPLPLVSGWSTFDAAGWGTPSFRMVGDEVQLRGMVNFVGTPPTTVQVNVGTLPPGYRPPGFTQNFPCWSNYVTGGVGYNNAIRMNVNSLGQVYYENGFSWVQTGNATAIYWIGLAPIRFSVTL